MVGSKENENKLSYDIDFKHIQAMAERMDSNRHKYEKGNWKKKINPELLKEALARHFVAYMQGETDEDHLIAMSCNLMMLYYQRENEWEKLPF